MAEISVTPQVQTLPSPSQVPQIARLPWNVELEAVMFQKILVAVDNSSAGEYVFRKALDVAKATGASLMLLHVLSSDEESYPALPGYDFGIGAQDDVMRLYLQQWHEFREQGLELLQARVYEAVAAGVNAESHQVPGEAGKAICEEARVWGADLIVVGRRGRSGLSELFLGSTSNYVLHHGPCSVLTVQPLASVPDEATQAEQMMSS
jgi:nucleotide-binding universal stress UspA family protein